MRKTLFGWLVGLQGGSQMVTTMCRSIALAIAALWSLPASAGDLPPASVYVAPGGVYIGSARVFVGPGIGNGEQPYAVPGPGYVPGYGLPAPTYAPEYGVPGAAYAPAYAPAPAYRTPPLSAYGARPTVGARVYGSPYAAEFAPRPPVAVPYSSGNNCVIAYGRVFCD
jgi:hypothetical protein